MIHALNDWRGIYAACFTPLHDDETLDTGAFQGLARSLLRSGLRGLYVTGSTGEGYALEDRVRADAFEAASSIAREFKARVIAHVGGVHTRRAVALARQAAESGCDAVAAVPPTGGRYGYEELTSYYSTLAEATPLPLLVYHIPVLSGYDFSLSQLSHWLELPNVIGIKYTSDDLALLAGLVARHPDKLIFHGTDNLLMQGLASGASGAIGATYNLLGSLALKISGAMERSDFAAASRGQTALNAFIESKNAYGGQKTMKAVAAKRFGWTSARSPHPASSACRSDCDHVQQAMEQALDIAETL
jgi:N-acetylneuraminate lyase